MPRRQRNSGRAAIAPPRRDAALKIDPDFADQLRHVMYDRDAACPHCRYNLSGIVGDRCPECGVRIAEYLRMADTTPWRLPARIRAAAVRKVLSWLIAPVVGGVVMLLAAWLALTFL